ncbi:MAG: flagellar basal body P-ring formation protein FlgA [Chthoniobacter sp.]|jgi:flagella basal body P-ring formation protein FlgA|nr:flagellar basal body P-ring formation protein FlgA [Chthoniobacter sp.]
MTLPRLTAVSFTLALLASIPAFGEDSLGSILDGVYLPPGGVTERVRLAPPAAKSAVHLVTENELLGCLEKELSKHYNPDGELRLSLGRPWQAIRVPSEDWQVTLPELPIGGLSKSFLVRVRISAGERAWFDQQVVVQAQLWKPVLVATRRLERGQALDRSAAEVQTLDVLRERLVPIPANTRLEDQEVLQTVVEGRPITSRDVATAPMVRKGAVVEVMAGDGNLSITMKGLAMSTGSLGDAITIRNMDTRKDFQARVVNRNSVRVSF